MTGDVFLHRGIIHGLQSNTTVLGTVPPPCTDVKAGDLNGDGATDVYVGARDANATYYLRNAGRDSEDLPTFGRDFDDMRLLVSDVPFVRLGAAADIDADGASLCCFVTSFPGDLDIPAGSLGDSGLVFWLENRCGEEG